MNLKLISSIIILFVSLNVFSQESLYSSFTIPENLKKGANAVVRLNDLNISIESRQDLIVIERRIITVLNEKGNSEVQAYSGYDKHLKVKKIQAAIFDENGNEIKKIKKKDFIDHSAVDGGTLYSDSRMLFMSYTPISYPYTVEFLCEIQTSSTAAIPKWNPINSYYVGIEKNIYTLIDKANLGLRFKEKRFEEYNIKRNNSSNFLSYKLENIPPIKPEDLCPPFSKLVPQVLVAVENFHFYGVDGKAKNWTEFGDWINNSLLAGRGSVTEETKQHILDITHDIEDPIERAKKVFDYVQNNTRYISVQVGIGGVQPISALEVDQLKYGDCKGLTNYTQSLLTIADVTSYYTIVEAGKRIIDFEDDFASLEQGNHIILAIPNEKNMVWLDCTSQLHPFNFIGDFTDNRNVLIVKPKSSKIIKTTHYPDTLNYQSTYADIKLNEDGSIYSSIKIRTKGIQYDNRFNIERQSKKDIVEYYKEYWGYVNNLNILDFAFENNKDKVEFNEEIKINASNYASFVGERLIFTANAFNKNTFIPNRYRNRKMPLEIERGYFDEDVFNYTIPEGYAVESLPENIYLENEFGKYKVEYSINNSQIFYKRKLLIKKCLKPKEEYEKYRSFRKEIAKKDSSKLVLIKTK